MTTYTGSNNGWQIYSDTTSIHVWNGPTTDRSLSWSVSTGTWYHFAIARSGGTVTLYLNGTSLGTVLDKDFSNSGGQLTIGADDNTGGAALNGWMDEIRISKGIARWTANFTPPTSPYS
jgi:hypothetical protein